jgi:type II secretory pathway component PulM
MNIEPEIIAAIIAGTVAILATIFTNLAMRKKNDADASEAISIAVANLIQPLNDRIDEQENEITKLKTRLADFLQGIRQLINQLRRQGCEPVWTPEELNQKGKPITGHVAGERKGETTKSKVSSRKKI